MTDRDLRKMNRKELLELLVEIEKENEDLRARVQEQQAQLQSREIRIKEAGTLAEAALALNGVLEAADRAAALYLENLKRCAEMQIPGECERPNSSDALPADEPTQAETT